MAPVSDLSRTIGLEQELFLVDEEDRISNRADELLSLCRVEAREKDLDPENFKGECAKNMVEINAGPKTLRQPRRAGWWSTGVSESPIRILINLACRVHEI
jgi:hypothetical protein